METIKKISQGFSNIHLFQGIFPVKPGDLIFDIIAGITLAALAIPEVMGYAKIAGMPIVTGLYTLLLPMAVFAVFCSSRHLVIGADSATAAIIAVSLVQLAAPGSPHYIALAGMVSLIAGAFLLLSRVFKLAFIADFFSRTVLIGFLTGVGIQVALSQLPEILGIIPGENPMFPPVFTILSEIGQVNLLSVLLSVLVITILLLGEKLTKKIPWTLLIVIISIIISYSIDLTSQGIAVIGNVPGGLPSISLPDVPYSEVSSIIGLAAACFAVILAQSTATSRAYASRYHETLDEGADLIGLGFANIAAGLSGTFVVNGSPTKTEMIDRAGGRTQIAHLVTVGIVLLVLLYGTTFLSYIPQAVLASVVLVIGVRLVDIPGLKQIQARRPVEFAVALMTTISVILTGVGWGLAFSVFLSIVAHLRHSYQPLNHLLYQDQEEKWSPSPLELQHHAVPGLIVYRFGANLYYANEGRMRNDVNQIVSSSELPIRWFCISGSSVNDVDYSASETLIHLYYQLRTLGIRLVFCDVEDHVRDELIRDKFGELIGESSFFSSKDEVVRAYQNQGD